MYQSSESATCNQRQWVDSAVGSREYACKDCSIFSRGSIAGSNGRQPRHLWSNSLCCLSTRIFPNLPADFDLLGWATRESQLYHRGIRPPLGPVTPRPNQDGECSVFLWSFELFLASGTPRVVLWTNSFPCMYTCGRSPPPALCHNCFRRKLVHQGTHLDPNWTINYQ